MIVARTGSTLVKQGQGHGRYFNFFYIYHSVVSDPITKLCHMVREMKLKHVVVYENILDGLNVEHCGVKVKVTIALAAFNHLSFQIKSRWLVIAESRKL